MTSFDPWQAQPPPPPTGPPTGGPWEVDRPASRTAALYCWVTGAVAFGLYGCCTLSFGALAAVPTSTWSHRVTPEQWEMLNSQPGISPRVVIALEAAMFLFLVNLPGLALIILGFWVRKASRAANLTALIIASVQGAMLGLFFLMALAGSLTMGNIIAGLGPLVYFLPLLVLLVLTWRALRRARTEPAQRAALRDDEPWNAHLG